ncbi:hypothetical protein CC86DRAFT_73528 [Ophiobolus disseminans]|uniref:Secreted protein n=1 Tax=Ophiobolus disseminans TaxID=1469910 RepID=A0A6A6ZRE6_9PLEO|nr:hypothetical protein CC86DRAFT_73528 [Ophiobolus disseminans]
MSHGFLSVLSLIRTVFHYCCSLRGLAFKPTFGLTEMDNTSIRYLSMALARCYPRLNVCTTIMRNTEVLMALTLYSVT